MAYHSDLPPNRAAAPAAPNQLYHPKYEQSWASGSGVTGKENLPCLQTGTSSIIQDMDALGRSCSAETEAGFQPAIDHPNSSLVMPSGRPRRVAPNRDALRPEPSLQRILCSITAPPKEDKDQERRQYQRRSRGRRSACSETVEDASSTSSDVRFKSKTRIRRQRHHLVLPSPSICPAPPTCCCNAKLSAHVRDLSQAQTWTADFARPPVRKGSRRTTPWRTRGSAPGSSEPRTKPSTKGTTHWNPPRAERASRSQDSITRGSKTYSLRTSQQRSPSPQQEPWRCAIPGGFDSKEHTICAEMITVVSRELISKHFLSVKKLQ